MRKRKGRFAAGAALLLIVAMLSACSQVAPEGADRSLTDMTGREIQLSGPVERVVALTPADCEILYALGAGDLLVGRGEYCDYPAEALALPAVQSGADINLEQIIALQPQVVLMSTMGHSDEQVKALQDTGAAVVVTDAKDIEGVYTAIRLIGSVVGKDTEAEKLVGDMQESFSSVGEKAAARGGEDKKSIYFEVSPLEYGLWTGGKGSFMDEIAAMLGLENVFGDVEGWAEISEEQVIQRNPDYIVTITMYYGEGPTPVEEIMSRPAWQNMQALQTGQVYNANNDEISRPGPRLAQAAEMLYELIYEGGAAQAQAS